MRHMRSRRILAMLLALSMIFGLLTTTALADNEVDQNTSNVGESAANGTSAGDSGEGQPSGASEDESSTETNKEDVPTEDETTPEEKKTTSSEEVDTQVGEGENAVALSDYITVNNDETQYATLEAAIAAAEPENGVITYTVHGSVHVETDGWIEIVKSGLTDITKVAFVGASENAEISTDAKHSILNEQTYGVDVIFENLTLSHPNGEWVGNTGHGAVYFTTWVHDSSKTVTYTNCKFPNGACNNQYGKTVYNNCSFENATTGLYNLWVYGGNVELNGGKFTGTRGAKVYTEGDPSAKTPMTVEINGTSFEGLNEKAAIVVSKAATVTLSDVTTTDCTKGTFQKDIEGSSDEEKVTITANGTGISGSFNVTAEKNVEAAKSEFNISAGSFTGLSAAETETLKGYLAPNTEISADGTVSSGATPATGVATVGSNTYPTLKEAFEAANNNDSIIINAGIYEMSDLSYLSGKTVTVSAQTDAEVTFDNAGAVNLGSANVTFQNIIFDYMPNQNYTGLQHAGDLTYEGCTFNGMVFLYGNSETFNTCTFNQTSADAYNVWTYGAKNVAFNSCTFNCVGKSVLVYNEGANAKTDLNVNDTKFNASAPVKGKAAIEIDTSLMTEGATITVDANTTAHGFAAGSNSGSTLWNDKNQTADTNKNTTVTVANETVFAPKSTGVAKGTEANPYTLDELGAMTRDAYIAAQKELGGTMYVTVGDYSYPDHGVLGNGKRDDTTGQTEDRSVLNGYNSNGYLDDKNDGANGKSIVFVNGSITSGVTGYETIDGITKITSLLLAVPAYTNVTFKGITFTNVMCFDYQLYTSPWSQLGELKFDGCKFNGIIIGSIAAQTLTFNGCTFENFKNTTKANNSNPTWIRPAYGNWTEGDNEGQGSDFRSLTTINFTNNTVESTRPVKFEYISQWNNTTTLTATGNTFDISAQNGDTETKNVGLYIGPHTDKNAVNLVLDNNTKSKGTAALYVIPKDMSKLPVGSTVKDSSGTEIEITDALEWKTTNQVTLKTEPVPAVKNVAKVGETEYATLKEAVAAVDDTNNTITLLTDVIQNTQLSITKSLTLDLAGHKIYNTKDIWGDTANSILSINNGASVTVTGNGTIDAKENDCYTINVVNGELTIENGTFYGNVSVVQVEQGKLTVNGGSFALRQKWPGKHYLFNCIDDAYKENTANVEIYGGTFDDFDPNVAPEAAVDGKTPSFAAPGVGITKNADGTFTAKTGMAAQVLDADDSSVMPYASLADAIAAAEAGQTVRQLADAKEDVEITKNITLDLGGKTLTNAGAGKATITIANGATATVKNGSVVGGTSYYNIQNNGTATFEGLTATAGNTGSSMLDNWGTLTIKSGTYTGGLNTVKSEEGSTLNISGGKFVSDYAPRYNVTGTILVYGATTISGGEFIQNSTSTAARTIVTGIVEGYSSKTCVTGGTFTCKGGAIFHGIGKATSDNFEVSGGTFNKSISEGFCADGFIPTKNADGTYGVKEGKYVAKVGSTGYETLEEAIKAVSSGKTVTLLDDITANGMDIKKSLTIDFNGKTLTVEDPMVGSTGTVTNAIRFLKSGKTTITVVLKNGTIKSSKARILIQNYANLTVDNMTLDLSEQPLYGYVLSNNNGKTVIKDTTISAPTAAGSLAFDSCAFTTDYGDVSVTLSGNSVINGNVGFSRDNAGDQAASLTLESGTINGELVDCGEGEGVTVTKTAAVSVAAPDGYKWVDGENGQTLAKIVMVAEVNGKQYETLQAAINAATKGQTVKLLNDTKENVTISKMLTLDLNGKTLNGGQEKGKPALTVTAKGVTVKDSSADMSGTIKRDDTAENSGVSSHYVIDIQGIGWLTFESGNVINNSGVVGVKGASLVRVGDDSVAKQPGLVINGGNFRQDNFIAIKVDRGYLTLNGGTITSKNSYAIENWFLTTIKGGTVNGTVASWTYSGGVNSTTTITGGTINGNVNSVNYGNAAGKTAKVTISGGTVNGELDTRSYDPTTNELTSIDDAAKATIGVTGGKFSKNPTKYVVEGLTVKENEDGTYGVEKAPLEYLAKVGNTCYYTMDDAFQAAATSGETLYLLRDYTTNAVRNSGSKSVTIVLCGYTWTYTGSDVNSAAFEVNHPNVTLTVKNGIVVSNSMIGLIPSATGRDGPITYDNSGLVFDNVQATAKGNSGIETNGNNTNDTVTLKNSTLNVPSGFGIYFPSSGKLTIDNSKITANTLGVQVCSGSLDISGAETKIEVTGDPVPKTENDGAIQDGAAISIVNRNGYKGLDKITVTGGTFTAKEGNDAVKAYNWTNKETGEENFTASGNVNISGGSYSTVVPADLCAEGFVPVTTPNTDGLYEITKDTSEAKIGNTKYATLADALKDATSGNTIVLLNDVTHATGFVLNDGILIDLNGHNLTTPFIFTSIEGGAGIIDSSNNANGGSGTLKLMFKKTTLNGISRTAKNSAGTADISGYFFPVFTGETTNEGTTWYNYKIYWGYVYSWPNSGTSTVDSIKFSFSVIFRNREAYQYFVNDPEQINVWFDVLLGNTEDGQQSNMSFKFTTDHIKTTWAQATINANGGVVKFNLTFKGLSEYAGATVYGTPYAQSNYTNASMNGSQLTATVQEQG